MKFLVIPSAVVGVFLLFQLLLLLHTTTSEIYTGTVGLECTDGMCVVSGDCDASVVVPGQDLGDGFYENITGQFDVSPTTCTADCDEGCFQILGSDKDEGGCIASAGYVYCPEIDNCIRPWEENCPFEGTLFEGPITIICDDGRCNNVTGGCAIDVDDDVYYGPYIWGLEGEHGIPEGCSGICTGCTEEGGNTTIGAEAPTEFPTETPSSGGAALHYALFTGLIIVFCSQWLMFMYSE